MDMHITFNAEVNTPLGKALANGISPDKTLLLVTLIESKQSKWVFLKDVTLTNENPIEEKTVIKKARKKRTIK
jgi:hypothetical protein